MAIIVKAAELGAFAAVAQATGLSAQMVAKHVVFLEDRLGTALLHRTTRRQSLTEIGRAYYERCRCVLAQAEAPAALAQAMHARPSGVLRVNAPVTFGSFSLAPFLTGYLARYPEMEIDRTLSDRMVDPLEEGFEVLIRIGGEEDASLVAHPLAPYRLIAAAAPAYLARRGPPRPPADLAEHDCLVYSQGASPLPCRWIFARGESREEAKVGGRFHCNEWKALLHAAVEGFGITLGPEDVLAGEIAAGRLVRVLPDYEGPARPMHVLHPAGRPPTAKIRSFVEAVAAAFGAAA